MLFHKPCWCNPRCVCAQGHQNEKNFVGLTVSRSGYLACGSEDNSAVMYSAHMPTPVARHNFAEGLEGPPPGARAVPHFVSSVAWTGSGRYLAAANSMGVLKVLEAQ